jgi:hypothetical protein
VPKEEAEGNRTRLFGSLPAFVYHCFDRMVINGYLSGLSRPEQVVYFFRQVLGIPVVSREVLSQRTNDYRSWVELATVMDQIEHGHHVLRAYWKHAFLKQYEKFRRYLRNELVSPQKPQHRRE